MGRIPLFFCCRSTTIIPAIFTTLLITSTTTILIVLLWLGNIIFLDEFKSHTSNLVAISRFHVSNSEFHRDIQRVFESKAVLSTEQSHPLAGVDVHEDKCDIPEVQEFPGYFKRARWVTPLLPNCSYEEPLVVRTAGEFVLNPSLKKRNITCCIQKIERGGHSDLSYSISQCHRLSKKDLRVALNTMEALLLKCGPYINLVTNVVLKPNISSRVNLWVEVPPEERPVSVILLGLDSVSRAHASRSLPKSMRMLKKLGFLDMKKYHSIAPSTLTNFLGFLSGMTRNQVRSSCSPDWNSTFDKCPFIWKEFKDAGYVTGYIEDWGQTFSWGGQQGFVDEPTDYYVHHCFLALWDARLKSQNSKMGHVFDHLKMGPNQKRMYDDLNLNCASNQPVYSHVLQYIQSFARTFWDMPFFLFSWINNPFHEVNNALPHFDSHLSTFLSDLFNNIPNSKNRLLFILLSDHGDRTSFFHSTSVQSFLERGLPPLLIHPPSHWNKTHPEMISSLERNQDVMVTPFDLHQSLRHVANLGRVKVRSVPKFYSLLWNPGSTSPTPIAYTEAKSMFDHISNQRKCNETSLPETYCLCNTELTTTTNHSHRLELSLQVVAKMVNKSVEHLNSRIRDSRHRLLCEKWSSESYKDMLYVKLISRTPQHVDYIVAFKASPGKAKFEARIQIVADTAILKKSNFLLTNLVKSMKVLGISRINKYGDQSLCVKAVTDEDKEIKEICMCTSYVKSG